jgi:phosphinothricin acetyltransferase
MLSVPRKTFFDSPTAGHAQPTAIRVSFAAVDTPIPDRPATKVVDYRLARMIRSALRIRPSAPADLAEITRIYGHAVRHGTGTFELDVPDEAEMAKRRDGVLAHGLPWLIAEHDGRVLGYAYANHFRPRRAYRFCLEDSIYLDETARSQGVGRVLLAELLAQCEARGARQMLAVIGDSANAGSVGVHRACGFEDVGVFKAAGWKFGRWLDVVLMQKALGEGSATEPRDG